MGVRWSLWNEGSCKLGLTVPALALVAPSVPLSASWANRFTSLSLSFLICKTGIMILSYRAVVRVKECGGAGKNCVVRSKMPLKCFLLLEKT